MTQRSNVTHEKFLTIEELAKQMLTYFLDEGGHGELFDAAKVLFSTNHEEIAKAFIYEAERMNEVEMLKNGLCSECGSELVNHHIPTTREYPSDDYPICSNTACRTTYLGRAIA